MPIPTHPARRARPAETARSPRSVVAALPAPPALREPPRAPSDAGSEDADENPAGPGWYESSWDLQQGLEVCEAPWPEPGFAGRQCAA